MPRKNHPARKTAPRKTVARKEAPQKAPRSEETSAASISYETQMIIVVLLLLFVYPIGLIFMWAWMNRWPMWLKVLLTIPLFLGVLALFSLIIFVATIIRGIGWQYRMEEQRQKMMRQYLSPTPTTVQETTVTPEVSPTETQSYTY